VLNNNLSLINKLSSELLFFSWVELKKNCIYSSELLDNIYIYPISRGWFYKVPSLIKAGKFSLKRRHLTINMYNGKKNYSSLLKNQVFEYAFILLLQPFFRNLFICKNLNWREYL
jgi:hypothetical protein